MYIVLYFIYTAPSSYLISADYSQIEMRVLAHCSRDPHMLRLFQPVGRSTEAELCSDIYIQLGAGNIISTS